MSDSASGMTIPADGGWRDGVRPALTALVISRLVVWLAAFAAIAIWGIYRPHEYGFDPNGITRPFGSFGDLMVAPGARWDTTWFLDIARDGYAANPDRAAFFPLYPAMIAVLAPVFGALVSGLLISFACFTGALVVFHRLAVLEVGAEAAYWGTLALALFPGALWFSAVYSESLFLLVSVGAVLAAREQRWLIAAVLGALAAATRSAGVLLAIPLALLWWDAYRAAGGPHAMRAALLAAPAVLLGLFATCVTFAAMGRGFRAPFEAEKTWNRSLHGPWTGLVDGTTAAWDGVRQLIHGQPPPVYFTHAGGDALAVGRHNILLWLTLVIAVVMLVGAWRRLRPAHAAYATAALLLPLSYPVEPQPLMSLPRFVSVLYPLFLWLGWWLARGSRRRAIAVLVISAAGLAFVSALFADWRWVA